MVVVVVVVEGPVVAAAAAPPPAAPAAAAPVDDVVGAPCSSKGAGRTESSGPNPPVSSPPPPPPPPGGGPSGWGPFSRGPCQLLLLAPAEVGELERRVQLALATKVPPKPFNGVSRNTCAFLFVTRRQQLCSREIPSSELN